MGITNIFRRSDAPPRRVTLEELRPRYFELRARYGQSLWAEREGLELRSQLEREDFLIPDDKFVFASPVSIAMYWELLDYVACGTTQFLIVGERGAGKEVLAQLIKLHSKKKRLIAVNCASLVDTLADAQLFGFAEHSGVSGAPTKGSLGFVGEANGQVLFLDEFFDAPPSVLPKLLRLLQPPREYLPVGAAMPKVLADDTIIVAASNRYACTKDLETAMEESSVRADLIDCFDAKIEVPPLRDRPREIGWIAAQMVKELPKALPFRELAEETRERLRLLPYNWPGNVRSLKQFIAEQARLRRHQAKGPVLDIPEDAIRSWFIAHPTEPLSGDTASSTVSKPGSLVLSSKEQVRDLKRMELVCLLMKSLLEHGRAQASADWVSEQCRRVLNVRNVSQKLKDTFGRSCKQLAEEVNHGLSNLRTR